MLSRFAQGLCTACSWLKQRAWHPQQQVCPLLCKPGLLMQPFSCAHAVQHVLMQPFSCARAVQHVLMQSFSCAHAVQHVLMQSFSCAHAVQHVLMQPFSCAHAVQHVLAYLNLLHHVQMIKLDLKAWRQRKRW